MISCCRYVIFAVVSAGRLVAQDAAQAPVPADKGSLSGSGKFEPKAVPSSAAAPDPVARLSGPGIQHDGEKIKIGLAELDRKTRAVSFPAKLHAVEGVIEYVVVHANGKIHETLFVTDALPQDIHTACLLAGWGKATDTVPSPVVIEASWDTNGPPRCERIENLVAFAKDHPQAPRSGHLDTGPWNYTGSLIDAGGFMATREGSVISVISDPAALAGNPRPSRENDALHVPNTALLPRLGFPVRITLRPVPPSGPHPSKSLSEKPGE